MFVVKVFAKFFRCFKLRNKMVMLISFADNPEQITKKMEELGVTPETVIYYDPRLNPSIMTKPFTTMIPIKVTTILARLYHLSTAKVVIIDNYFPELAAVKWREGVTCLQIWHANGALKKFAWEDKSVPYRKKKEQERFKSVYQAFQYVVTGSDEMATIFKRSFLLDEKRILKIGVPSTDFFFNLNEMETSKHKVLKQFPNKKIILYAPTFRDHELNKATVLLDIKKMEEMLASDYILLLKLHPAITKELAISQNDFVKQVPNTFQMKDLLAACDILITDYSSSPFEFALLKRPIYFFTPDLEKYDQSRGLVSSFQNIIPGKIYRTTTDLAKGILNHEADLEKIAQFARTWNQYSNGHSSENIVRLVAEKLTKE
ncbi:CDP-glycerol glycerophosphotransferase family protein [Listeria sp. PSOL-1]|uniref:CDP-glycerol glycerophosphotransferase family protein n=1 Tax=Listeria sp. PSOL-1 TaxID=1844999 RepID=UPI0021023053|nr:CDP-glycerol glycerophosphotransferase family protein [Listeria sp. PSOL-1]